MFDQFDTDKSGDLTDKELKRALTEFEASQRRFDRQIIPKTQLEADELGHAIGHLPDAAAQFLHEEDLNVSQIANALNDQQALLLVGGGPNWISAREGALKVEEESSLLCKAYRPAGYLHNAIPVLADTVGTIVIAPPGKAYGRLHDVVRTARAARAAISAGEFKPSGASAVGLSHP